MLPPPPVPLFALGFAAIGLLPWLAAASIPVVIHLLNRRRFRETSWAAMRFLVAALRKNSRRIRLEQWLLLAVRTLLVLLLVAALARPFLEQAGALPVLVGRRTHRVLAIDGSMSMAFTEGGATRFDKAKQVAAEFVRAARTGDLLSVVLLADPPRVVVKGPSPNRDEVLKELATVIPTQGTLDLEAAFAKVAEVLAASETPQKEVVVLTDLQATSWSRPGGPTEALKKAVAKLSNLQPRSVVVDLGAPGGTNLAITDLTLDAPIVTQGSTPGLTASVKNFGPRPAEARVRFFVDHQQIGEQTVSLEPGADQAVGLAHAFASPGERLVEARIDDDALAPDDRRCLAVPVRESIEVLLVDGDPRAEPFTSEADYLAQALSPEAASPGTPAPIRVEVVPGSQLARVELPKYDAVALCNLDQFDAAEIAALDAYVKQGGGLVVFGGDQVIAENYNRYLYNDGQGLVPAAYGPPVGDAKDKVTSRFSLDPLGFRHPIVSAFGGQPDVVTAGLTQVKAWQYHKLIPPKGSPAAVALAFDTGDPAILTWSPGKGGPGRGRVIQVATSADVGWTNWPVHPSYPVIMEQLIDQAAAGRRAERNALVGQPLDQALPAEGAGASVNVIPPDTKATPTKLAAEGDVSRLHFSETDLAGPYQVQIGPPLSQDLLFAAGTDPAESDPAKLDGGALKASLPGWAFQYESDWRRLLGGGAASVGHRGELHRALLYGVLALLLFESLLAWKFGHND